MTSRQAAVQQAPDEEDLENVSSMRSMRCTFVEKEAAEINTPIVIWKCQQICFDILKAVVYCNV